MSTLSQHAVAITIEQWDNGEAGSVGCMLYWQQAIAPASCTAIAPSAEVCLSVLFQQSCSAVYTMSPVPSCVSAVSWHLCTSFVCTNESVSLVLCNDAATSVAGLVLKVSGKAWLWQSTCVSPHQAGVVASARWLAPVHAQVLHRVRTPVLETAPTSLFMKVARV